jgi:hypothetical protein
MSGNPPIGAERIGLSHSSDRGGVPPVVETRPAPCVALPVPREEALMPQEQEKKHEEKGVLDDKERFGRDEAEEKLKHMGEKSQGEQSRKSNDSKTSKG